MKPGDFTGCVDDNRQGSAIVLATSRHKCTYDRAAAERELQDSMGDPVSFEIVYWRSHTRRYMAEFGCWCLEEEPDGLSWCTEGDGKAWVKVLAAFFAPRPEDTGGH